MSMTDKFNISNFVIEYKRYPCLWDKSHNHYKNRNKRDSAEETLLQLSGLANIKELRQKIRILRCTYNQELAKIKGSMRTDSGTVYKPKLAWFESADSFLRKNYEENDNTLTNLVLDVTESTNTLNEDFNSSQELLSSTECDEYVKFETDDTINSSNETNVTFKTPKRKAKTVDKPNKQQKLNNAIEALKFAYSQKPTSNECQMFGQHVAAQLEKLPLTEALRLQTEIQNILTQARLRPMNNIISALMNKLLE